MLAVATVAVAGGAASGTPGLISDVSISAPFFNPLLGQKIGISFSLAEGGKLTIQILDRDGYLVRRLVSEKTVEKGSQGFDWEGRDDEGRVVPDEAYSLKIDLSGRSKTSTYFPASRPVRGFSITSGYYDRRGGVLAYKVPVASRVHVQAGSARIDPRTKKPIGPVLKTVVNREPRVAGSVVENWNGLDESGTIRVSDLPNFRVAIAAMPLPENSVITIGNHSVTFLERAAKRDGPTLLTTKGQDHHHHRGLSALEDVSPNLEITVPSAVWSRSERLWTSGDADLKVRVSLSGPSARVFAREPARLHVFMDQEPLQQLRSPINGLELTIPAARLERRIHNLAINWESDYGPVAVNSLRIRLGKAPTSVSDAREGQE